MSSVWSRTADDHCEAVRAFIALDRLIGNVCTLVMTHTNITFLSSLSSSNFPKVVRREETLTETAGITSLPIMTKTVWEHVEHLW